MRSISEKQLDSHQPSSDSTQSQTRRREHLRADGTPRRIGGQSAIDRGSQTQRSFLPFSLYGTTGRQKPFCLKRRLSFSRLKRSHPLFQKYCLFVCFFFFFTAVVKITLISKKNLRHYLKKKVIHLTRVSAGQRYCEARACVRPRPRVFDPPQTRGFATPLQAPTHCWRQI